MKTLGPVWGPIDQIGQLQTSPEMLEAPKFGASNAERVTRIELALSAWEADVLPLNYTRGPARDYTRFQTWHRAQTTTAQLAQDIAHRRG